MRKAVIVVSVTYEVTWESGPFPAHLLERFETKNDDALPIRVSGVNLSGSYEMKRTHVKVIDQESLQ